MRRLLGLLWTLVGICLSGSCSDPPTTTETEPNGASFAPNVIEPEYWIEAVFGDYRDHDYFQVDVPESAKVITIEIDASKTPPLMVNQRTQITASIATEEPQMILVEGNGFDSRQLLEGSLEVGDSHQLLLLIECGGLHPTPRQYRFRIHFR